MQGIHVFISCTAFYCLLAKGGGDLVPNQQTYGFRNAHTMDYSRRGGLFMPATQQTSVPAITVKRNFLGQQTVEALLLELIRAHMQPV